MGTRMGTEVRVRRTTVEMNITGGGWKNPFGGLGGLVMLVREGDPRLVFCMTG